MEERQQLDANRLRAKMEYEGSQPLVAFMLADAMSCYAGNTPKVGSEKTRHSKGDRVFMENRIMAVEVVCGPLEYTSLFHSSDIIAGGGNYMIQVLKLAIEQLSNNLRELGFILPKELLLQFDNSGENKNRDMFSYISLLVELLVFDSVEVNFLIVGHTHCSIDRLFGIYSSAIRGADFIASPLALRALLDNACPDRKHYHTDVLSVYDWRAFFKPYANNKIKYYSIPHKFKFFLVYSKCVFQYKLYSAYETWLPLLPMRINDDLSNINQQLSEMEISQIQLPEFLTVGNETQLHASLDADVQSSTDLVRQADKLKILQHLQHMRDTFLTLEVKAIDQQIKRHLDESENSIGQARYDTDSKSVILMQAEICKRIDDKEVGYMWWLKDDQKLPHIMDTKPNLVHSKCLVEELLRGCTDNDAQRSTLVSTATQKIFLRNKVDIIVKAAQHFEKNIYHGKRFSYDALRTGIQ